MNTLRITCDVMGKGIVRNRSDAADQGHGDDYTVIKLTDYTEILSRLKARASYSIPVMKYLEPRYLNYAQWYLATSGPSTLRRTQGEQGEKRSEALCLYVKGNHGRTVFTMGDSLGLEHVLKTQSTPRNPYLIYEAHHQEVLSKFYLLQKRQKLLRMVVDREIFNPVPVENAAPLKPENNMDVNSLYTSEGGGWFSREYLAHGVYYGVWKDGMLVAVAGTQTVSKTYGVAMVANVLTDPRYRGLGYASECTSAVTAKLFENCDTVALNVEVDNDPAIRVYTKLGYKKADYLEEAWGLRKGGLFGFIAGFFDGLTKGKGREDS